MTVRSEVTDRMLVFEPVNGRIRHRPIPGGIIDEYETAAWNRCSATTAAFWNPTGSQPDAR